jgi:hypothetical protein
MVDSALHRNIKEQDMFCGSYLLIFVNIRTHSSLDPIAVLDASVLNKGRKQHQTTRV